MEQRDFELLIEIKTLLEEQNQLLKQLVELELSQAEPIIADQGIMP